MIGDWWSIIKKICDRGEEKKRDKTREDSWRSKREGFGGYFEYFYKTYRTDERTRIGRDRMSNYVKKTKGGKQGRKVTD